MRFHSHAGTIGKYPFLTVSQVALNILSIAVTNVPNERTFSTAGNLSTKRRNRMSNPIIQASICLNSIFNSKFYNLKQIRNHRTHTDFV